MSFTAEHSSDAVSSMRSAWHHCKEAFLASSPSAAWQSIKNMVHAMPMWMLLLTVVLVTIFVLNPLTLSKLATYAALLLAVYFTVRQAVRDEHRRPREADES